MVAVVRTPHAPAAAEACGVPDLSVKKELSDAVLVRWVSGRGRRRGSGAQVAQGVVRGAARLSRGDARGAVVEAAAGLAAPAVTAVRRFMELGADVCKAAAALSAAGPA